MDLIIWSNIYIGVCIILLFILTEKISDDDISLKVLGKTLLILSTVVLLIINAVFLLF